ncbi:MAG TPA: ATPase, partial [Candidatus Wallbacteria bacterium]|nr:ATPase [Candidatus Wallbacteria bacterium]
EIFFVDLPEASERAEIFKIHLKKREIPYESFDMKAILDASEGFSGAEIEQAIIASLFEAFYKNEGLKCEFLLKALLQTVPLSKTMKEEIDSLRSWAASRAVMASRPVETAEGARPKRRLEF